MEELLKQVADKLGYAAPLVYAGMAYRLFGWLDNEVSAQAKAALSRAMKLDAIGRLGTLPLKQLADALVEVFDRLYTFPLKSGRAFLRSALLTIVVTLVFLYEMRDIVTPVTSRVVFSVIYATLFNVVADYISLFIIRAWLVRAGRRPIVALLGGTLIGAAFVYVVTIVRTVIPVFVDFARTSPDEMMSPNAPDIATSLVISLVYGLPGVVVFAWLPLFALAMLLIRALGPLTKLVALAKCSMKDGEEHPLKAVGLVAALLTLLLAAGWQAVARSAATDASHAHLSPVHAAAIPSPMHRGDPVGAAQAL